MISSLCPYLHSLFSLPFLPPCLLFISPDLINHSSQLAQGTTSLLSLGSETNCSLGGPTQSSPPSGIVHTSVLAGHPVNLQIMSFQVEGKVCTSQRPLCGHTRMHKHTHVHIHTHTVPRTSVSTNEPLQPLSGTPFDKFTLHISVRVGSQRMAGPTGML